MRLTPALIESMYLFASPGVCMSTGDGLQRDWRAGVLSQALPCPRPPAPLALRPQQYNLSAVSGSVVKAHGVIYEPAMSRTNLPFKAPMTRMGTS